ncbi:MAG: hypothetical protein AAF141_01040 [Pseudomonadota bacterium]
MAAVSGAAGLFVRISTALFPIALGLAGLAGVFHFASLALDIQLLRSVSLSILLVACIVLAADVLLYLIKLAGAHGDVIEDFSMATSANLLAPGFMAAMVIGGLSVSEHGYGEVFWVVGTLGHLALLFAFVGQWLRRDYDPGALNPTWFLPSAGIMTSAMTWPGNGPMELPLFTLAVGGVLWAMLLPLVFRRMVLEPAVDPKLRPTLFIIAAPFGLMAGALLNLFPELPPTVALMFLFAGTFLIVVLISQTRFLNRAGATLAWWAPTFPVSTVASGYLRLPNPTPITEAIGLGLMVLACITTALAIIATFHTALHIFRGDTA